MDIGSRDSNPVSRTLSNFHAHCFELDGVVCNSMEGFLQSLKFKPPDIQADVCKLIGIGAKRRGSGKNWQRSQTLHWRGMDIKRRSQAYQDLLDRAYDALASQSEKFREALLATGNAKLTHSIGRVDPSRTVLTRQEFCSRLTKIRTRLQSEQEKGEKKS